MAVVVTVSATGGARRAFDAVALPEVERLREEPIDFVAASGCADEVLWFGAAAEASSLSTDSRAARLVGAGGKGM